MVCSRLPAPPRGALLFCLLGLVPLCLVAANTASTGSGAAAVSARHFEVFLDVGHGGFDPGGTGPDGLPESFVNLSVAMRLAKILRSDGIAVVMDRTINTFVSLPERVSLADESGADLFLGLYCNASADRAIHGTTTYYYHKNAYGFARYLETQVSRSLDLSDDGVVPDNLYVIRYTTQRMPDVLIEYAYISNYHEESLLANPAFRERIAVAIAGAITSYFALPTAPPEVPPAPAGIAPPIPGNGATARITAVETANGAVEILSSGEPAVGTFWYGGRRSAYLVVTLRHAILDGRERTFSVPPPFNAAVTVAQFSVSPDVVHLVIHEAGGSIYRVATKSTGGGSYVTTVYPSEY